MAPTIPTTKGNWLVTIEGFDYYWETFSGLEDIANTSEYSDGLGNRIYKLVGRRQIGDMTMTKAFDPVNDKPIVDFWKGYCESRESVAKTVSIVPVRYCPDPEPVGATLILYGFKPISLKGFEVDKKSGDINPLALGFIADDWKYE